MRESPLQVKDLLIKLFYQSSQRNGVKRSGDVLLKAGFHKWRSHSRKSPYDVVKIEKWSHKRSHKLDRIGAGRIRTFPFLPIMFTTQSLMIQWKLGCQSRRQKRKNQPIARPRVKHTWCMSLVYPSASAWDSDNAVFTWLSVESWAESVFCFWLHWIDFH